MFRLLSFSFSSSFSSSSVAESIRTISTLISFPPLPRNYSRLILSLKTTARKSGNCVYINFARRLFSSRTMEGLSLLQVVGKLNNYAPTSLAASWDNVGLLVEPSTPKTVKMILLTNDLTKNVMDEAVEKSADLIISYHPPIFSPLKKITANTWKERLVARCLEHRIALYSPHTCFDALKGGVNDWLAEAFDSSKLEPILSSYAVQPSNGYTHMVELPFPFSPEGKSIVRNILMFLDTVPEAKLEEHISTVDGYENLIILCPESTISSIMELVRQGPVAQDSRCMRIIKLEKPPLPGFGMGRICHLREPVSLQEATEKVKQHLKLQHIRLAVAAGASLDSLVSTVAVCAGSGASILHDTPADLYLTGEMSHHEVLDAVQKNKHVILCEHSNTERGYLKQFAETLKNICEGKVEVFVSEKDKDPLIII